MKRSLTVIEKITGFTLAEVLITLTVIGVIAALTIPSLITNIQDQQYRTAWKKAYSDLSQVARRISTDNGGTMKALCGDATNASCFFTANNFPKYLSVTKICTTNSSTEGCWHQANNWYALDGSSAGAVDNYAGNKAGSFAGVILNNGMMMFGVAITDAPHSYCAQSTALWLYCGHITIDINGFKGPNTLGKDIFAVFVMPDGSLKPVDSTNYNCSTNGYGCSALYLKQ